MDFQVFSRKRSLTVCLRRDFDAAIDRLVSYGKAHLVFVNWRQHVVFYRHVAI